MSKLILLCGVPHCGKTTIIRNYCRDYCGEPERVSSNKITKESFDVYTYETGMKIFYDSTDERRNIPRFLPLYSKKKDCNILFHQPYWDKPGLTKFLFEMSKYRDIHIISINNDTKITKSRLNKTPTYDDIIEIEERQSFYNLMRQQLLSKYTCHDVKNETWDDYENIIELIKTLDKEEILSYT
jgi:GTPase SAR1 family protein